VQDMFSRPDDYRMPTCMAVHQQGLLLDTADTLAADDDQSISGTPLRLSVSVSLEKSLATCPRRLQL